MTEYGKGWNEQGRIGNRYILISWDNGSNKYADFRIDINNRDWTRTGGNHNKQLPRWVLDKAMRG